MIVSSPRNMEEAKLLTLTTPPVAKSDYYMVILVDVSSYARLAKISKLDVKAIKAITLLPVVGFTIPESGVTWNPDPNMWTHQIPSFNSGIMQVTFTVPFKENSLIEYLWEAQFTEEGAVSASWESMLPDVYIYRIDTRDILFVLEGCHFTYPKPSVDLSSSDYTVYSCNISYEQLTQTCVDK